MCSGPVYIDVDIRRMIRLSFLSQVHTYFTGRIMRANRSLMLTVFSLCVTPVALKLIDMYTESVADIVC